MQQRIKVIPEGCFICSNMNCPYMQIISKRNLADYKQSKEHKLNKECKNRQKSI